VGEGGEGVHRDEVVAMLTHGGQMADDITRGGRQRGWGEASGKCTTRQEGGCANISLLYQ
jgi:hypothetical protein